MNRKKTFFIAAGMLAAFVLWTAAVCCIDVQPIGPRGSAVGFAAANGAFHRLTGVHFTLYLVTDWLGLVPVFITFGFALLGLVQWVKRKRIDRVDADILILGVFYLVVFTAYLLFEAYVINYRPVLINGFLEASYPSSHTMLVVCVLTTAAMQIRQRFPARKGLCLGAEFAAGLLCSATAVGRLLSGMHWLTDIVGGLLASAALVALYGALQES